MRRIITKIKPAHGFAHILYIGFNVILPMIVYVLVRINFVQLALAVIVLSKWRMLAVRPRHWPANIRANAIDIIVGVSFLIFMSGTSSSAWQLIWTGAYALWLLALKPIANPLGVSLQALVGQFVGLMALFMAFGGASLWALVVGTWLIAYITVRHFMGSFDEPMTRLLSYLWAYFAAALVWILGHWLLFYGRLAQPTLLLSVIGYGLATLYYLRETDKLSRLVRRQLVLLMVAVCVVIVVFSNWGDRAV